MDRIIISLVDSTFHSLETKVAATTQITLKALKSASHDDQQRTSELFVKLLSSNNEHGRLCGKAALDCIISKSPSTGLSVLDVRWVTSILQYGMPWAEALGVLHSWLPMLMSLDKLEYKRRCAVVATTSRRFLLQAHALPPQNFLLLVRIWHENPMSTPPWESLSSGLVHTLATMPTTARDVPAVVALSRLSADILGREWGEDTERMLVVLANVYEELLGEATPNMALAFVLRDIPASMIDSVTAHVISISAPAVDEKLVHVLSGLLPWLNTGMPTIHLWILGFLRGFAASRRFAALVRATDAGINLVCKSLSDPATRPGTLEVFRYMLLSYQHSSQAFHTTLPVLVPLVRRLRSQDPVPAKFLDALACLCHTMMFKFPGYPLLYADLLECIEGLAQPTGPEMQEALRTAAWAANRDTLPLHVVPRAPADKTGLVNHGNTCYFNSVVQALYMTAGFRQAILSQEPSPKFASTGAPQTIVCIQLCPSHSSAHPQGDHLQTVFALLLHSPRSAVSPRGLLNCCTPPWFIKGAQQDSDEQLKFMLESLEKEGQEKARVPMVDQSYTQLQKEPGLGLAGGEDGSPMEIDAEATVGGDVRPLVNVSRELGANLVLTGRPTTATPAAQSLIGEVAHEIKCRSCGNVSRSIEPFTDLPLPAPSDIEAADASILWDKSFEAEVLSGDDLYHCESCQTKSEAERRLVISEAPNNIVLRLSRFAYDTKKGTAAKLCYRVSLPPEISVPIGDDQTSCYRLYAVVYHAGKTLESGHYFCCAAAGPGADEWFMFNDSVVSRMSFGQVQQIQQQFATDTPYMLFYTKVGAPAIVMDVTLPPHLETILKRDRDAFVTDLNNERHL